MSLAALLHSSHVPTAWCEGRACLRSSHPGLLGSVLIPADQRLIDLPLHAELMDLREKFKEDKRRIAELKASRKFRPV